jgi:hypothetical protein
MTIMHSAAHHSYIADTALTLSAVRASAMQIEEARWLA